HRARLELRRRHEGTPQVGCEIAGLQSIGRIVGRRDSFREGIDRLDGCDRAEDLLAPYAQPMELWLGKLDQRWRHHVALALITGENPGAGRFGLADPFHYAVG